MVVSVEPVENNVFEVTIALEQDRTDRLFDELPLIVARGHDRDARPSAAVGPLRGQSLELGRPRPSSLAERWREVNEHRRVHVTLRNLH